MPPKKKGGKKKKKGGKSGKKSAKSVASASSAGGHPNADKLTEAGKGYYLVQINDLEKRLIKLQRKCDELEILNKHFGKQSEQITGDKKEICEYLKKSVEQRLDEITEMNYQFNQLQEALDSERDSYEDQIRQVTTELKETKEQLQSENLILTGKLSSMEEYKAQQQELLAKFKEIELEIDKVRHKNEEVVYVKEREAVVEKDRLRKEMIVRVNSLASEFRKVSNKQMAETTKRTIRENVDMNARLQKLSEQAMKVMAENDSLRAQHKDLKLQHGLMDDIEKQLTRKNYSKVKSIKEMVNECRETEKILSEFDTDEKSENDRTVMEEYEELCREVEQNRQELDGMFEQKKELSQNLEDQNKIFTERKKVLRKIKLLMRNTGKALEDAQTLLEPDEEMTEAEIVDKRQKMLQALLTLLNSAAVIGLGPAPRDLGLQNEYENDDDDDDDQENELSNMVESRKHSAHGAAKSVSTISAEKLAQFGLEPATESHSKYPSTELFQSLSPMTRIHRTPYRSTGTQSADPKGMLYSDKLMKQFPKKGTELFNQLNEKSMKTSPPLPPIKRSIVTN